MQHTFSSSSEKSNAVVRLIRIGLILVHIFYGIILIAFVFGLITDKRKNNLIRQWSCRLLRIFNLDFQVSGKVDTLSQESVMYVANHISWLDIHLLASLFPVKFIAKAEVRKWALFGWFARNIGTLFVDRTEKKDSLRIIHEITSCLNQGESVCFFPEGTTTDGTCLLQFKPSLFQGAIDAGVNIRPFLIQYLTQDNKPDTRMAFVGQQTLVESIWKIIGIQKPQARIIFLPTIKSGDYTRSELASLSKTAIEKQLHV
jgi:1-acyl-sn-glycerol-3-phosphate acyltransferase